MLCKPGMDCQLCVLHREVWVTTYTCAGTMHIFSRVYIYVNHWYWVITIKLSFKLYFLRPYWVLLDTQWTGGGENPSSLPHLPIEDLVRLKGDEECEVLQRGGSCLRHCCWRLSLLLAAFLEPDPVLHLLRGLGYGLDLLGPQA